MKTSCEHCGSSDGKHIYEDHTYCYVCNKHERLNMTGTINEPVSPTNTTIGDIIDYRSYPIGSRGISQDVVDHFDVKMSTDPDGKPESHYYPFTKNGQVVAYKERKLPKEFRTHGDFQGAELFGQSVAQNSKILVVTEGELDAMAMAQAFYTKTGKFYASVSLPNGVNSVKSLLVNRDWVRSFDTVVLMFDMDDVGQAAVEEAAKIVGMGRAKVAKLPAKDPCDTLQEFGANVLVDAVYKAQSWNPAGILTGEQIWEQYMKRKNTESIPYPDCLTGLNDKLGGIRHGEITLFTSGTGSGKSTVIKEIILDLLDKTEDKIGLISLEESIGDTADKFIGMALERPVSGHPPLTDEELREGFDRVFSDERLVLLDHQGSVSDASLIDKIEYMALMGCKYLVLDHITIAVSEGAEGLTGNEAVDKIMSDLLKIVKQHDVWLGLISHLRKSQGKSFEEGQLASIDDIKGSGSIKQISFDIVAFARNLVAEEDYERNTIQLRVLKSRFTGRTGDAGSAVYNPDTTRLQAGQTGFTVQ